MRSRRVLLATSVVGVALGGLAFLTAPASAGGSVSVSTGAQFATAFQDGTTDEIVLTANITLPGEVTRPGGADDLVIQGGGFTLTAAPNSSMLRGDTSPAGELTVNDLTITGANPLIGQVGAILWFDSDVTLNRSTLTNNTVLTTPIRVADQDGVGDESITVNDSTITDNQGANGGALRADVVIANRSTFSGNVAGNGGAIDANLNATITDSVFTDNEATGSIAGAVNVASHLEVLRSTFTQNTARLDGGAIAVGSSARIEASTVADNEAGLAGGNGGGIHVLGDLELVNTTVSGNTASGSGGGVHAINVTAIYSTITGNSAATAANIAAFAGGPGTLTNFATVVSDPSGGGQNCDGFTAVGEHSYEADGSSCGFATSNGADPQLGALADNGGPTETHLPAAASPLVGAVPAADCDAGAGITEDQRGQPRPVGAGCDIGAVEVFDEDLPPPPEPPVDPPEQPIAGSPSFTG